MLNGFGVVLPGFTDPGHFLAVAAEAVTGKWPTVPIWRDLSKRISQESEWLQLFRSWFWPGDVFPSLSSPVVAAILAAGAAPNFPVWLHPSAVIHKRIGGNRKLLELSSPFPSKIGLEKIPKTVVALMRTAFKTTSGIEAVEEIDAMVFSSKDSLGPLVQARLRSNSHCLWVDLRWLGLLLRSWPDGELSLGLNGTTGLLAVDSGGKRRAVVLGCRAPYETISDQQNRFFVERPTWAKLWEGMPEFKQGDAKPLSSITVHFATDTDRLEFLTKLGEKKERKKSIWYPKREYLNQSERGAVPLVVAVGNYPVYIISKGRWGPRLTSKALEELGLPYYIVIEPQEKDAYAAVINPSKILTLPFSNLGRGSIPARNWVWEHAIKSGARWHWILDDNIDGWYRLNKNLKTKVVNENPFIPVEDFVDRYRNVVLAGHNYEFFINRRELHPPIYTNTRIYSCILIKNDLPYRWRGRYNEDTDLSLRALKDGWCTVLFNAYLAKKMPTMKLTGGNTDELYQGDGRLEMAKSLQQQHPDVVKITRKWGRWQHQVDYSKFKNNKLEPRQGT